MIEMVLSITALAILAGVAAMMISPWAKSYSTIAAREASHDDTRFAFEKMSREIQMISQGNVQSPLTSSQFSFIDSSSVSTSYNLSATTLYRGTDKLLTNVTSLTFTCYDSSNATTTTPANVRRVQIVMTIDPATSEAQPINLRTDVFLRNYVYDNYVQ